MTGTIGVSVVFVASVATVEVTRAVGVSRGSEVAVSAVPVVSVSVVPVVSAPGVSVRLPPGALVPDSVGVVPCSAPQAAVSNTTMRATPKIVSKCVSYFHLLTRNHCSRSRQAITTRRSNTFRAEWN